LTFISSENYKIRAEVFVVFSTVHTDEEGTLLVTVVEFLTKIKVVQNLI